MKIPKFSGLRPEFIYIKEKIYVYKSRLFRPSAEITFTYIDDFYIYRTPLKITLVISQGSASAQVQLIASPDRTSQ